MIGRVLLAALLAGIVAGLFMGALQHWKLTPLIIAAEKYETAGHDHGADAAAHEYAAEAWAPADGAERTLYTTLTVIVTGAAFAALLAGIALVFGIPLTLRNGAIWGLMGFLAASLAPAAGLPPELPGMPAADLDRRQLWWLGTIAATAGGIALLVLRREAWAIAAAVVLIALPHLVGAPAAADHASALPAGLAAQFAAASLAANAAFWIVLGVLLGWAMDRFVTGPRQDAA
jgi:cobalt transporter subunit CbtA